MRFAFIAAKKAEHTVSILCRCLRVTTDRKSQVTGYTYDALDRATQVISRSREE